MMAHNEWTLLRFGAGGLRTSPFHCRGTKRTVSWKIFFPTQCVLFLILTLLWVSGHQLPLFGRSVAQEQNSHYPLVRVGILPYHQYHHTMLYLVLTSMWVYAPIRSFISRTLFFPRMFSSAHFCVISSTKYSIIYTECLTQVSCKEAKKKLKWLLWVGRF